MRSSKLDLGSIMLVCHGNTRNKNLKTSQKINYICFEIWYNYSGMCNNMEI